MGASGRGLSTHGSPALPTDRLCLPRVCLLGVLALTISWGTLGLELAVSVVSGRV